jgi:hypothetical protein
MSPSRGGRGGDPTTTSPSPLSPLPSLAADRGRSQAKPARRRRQRGFHRPLPRGGRARVAFLGPGHGHIVEGLDGGAWPRLGDNMTDGEAVVSPACGTGRGGGELQGETLGPLLLASWRPVVEG